MIAPNVKTAANLAAKHYARQHRVATGHYVQTVRTLQPAAVNSQQ